MDAHRPHGKLTFFFRLRPGVHDALCPFTSGVVSREQGDFDISRPGGNAADRSRLTGRASGLPSLSVAKVTDLRISRRRAALLDIVTGED
jgi:hypothetical protein